MMFNFTPTKSFWAGTAVGAGTTFFGGWQYLKQRQAWSTPDSHNALLSNFFYQRGWRPGKVMLDNGLSFYISYFQPALFGSVALSVAHDPNTKKKYLIVNTQSRTLKDGTQEDVIDFACGFHQSNQKDLAFKKLFFSLIMTKQKQLGRALSADELQQLATTLQQHVQQGEKSLPTLQPADYSVIDTALREMKEETGYRGLSLRDAQHLSTYTTQDGTYLIHLVSLNYDMADTQLAFHPEKAEGIKATHLVELNPDNFRFSLANDGEVLGMVKTEHDQWLTVKPYDETPRILATFLNHQHGLTFKSLPKEALFYPQNIQNPKYIHQQVALEKPSLRFK